ncbi:hypothetical protein SO802_000444 [Lithocarpus litseifolius]|uniref:DUF4283 domain-containing protein n=1 Tax=Lithocarpus litseifolius TaxID=425828 RepID=A0AAW2DVR8_9ROSI
MEKLMGSWEKLSLSEPEGSKFAIRDDPGVEEHILAAKFLTRRALNMEAIAKTFTLLWKTRKGFEIRDMGDHKVLLVFPDAADVDKVLMREPWTFDRHLVVLEKLNSVEAFKELSFNQTSFYVQVHDLPVRRSSLEVAMEIVSVMGNVDVRMSKERGSSNFNFFRTRVSVDITKPLCRGRRITMSSGKEGWVSFKYERLPNICYWCGRLTYGDKECLKWVKSRGTLKVEDQQFGTWLRAATPSMSQRTVIRVAGMDEEDIRADDDQQKAGKRGDEGNGSRERKTTAAEEERVARHREEDNDVLDNINEGVLVTESPTNPDSINDDDPIMDVTFNSLAYLNPGNNKEKADFSEQLEEIDKELLKFDNVHVSGVISGDNVSKEDLGIQRVHSVIRLGEVGLHFNDEAAKEENMIPKRGWVLPSIGWGGGLALLWKEEDMVWVDSFSNYNIDAIVHRGSERAWWLTRFYGEPETSRRSDGWNMLRMLSTKPKLPWCCFGDFNELLEVADKKGGALRSHNLMQSFWEVLDDCGFIDLGFSGPEFTWHGKRRGELVWERLDRGVPNYEWLNKFPMGSVQHLHCFTANHRPLLLALDPNGESHKWKRKPFRFEAMWLMDPGYSEMVTRA